MTAEKLSWNVGRRSEVFPITTNNIWEWPPPTLDNLRPCINVILFLKLPMTKLLNKSQGSDRKEEHTLMVSKRAFLKYSVPVFHGFRHP